MSVTPQINEPEVEGASPAVDDGPGSMSGAVLGRSEPTAAPTAPRSRRARSRRARSTGPNGADRQLEARVVTRLVRHVSPWSVFKVSALLYATMYVVVMLAGIGLWTIAANRGLIGSVESFMDELLAEEDFRVDGTQVLRLAATVGFVGVATASALTVLFSIIFNLISDVTGGVRLSVVELETARPRRRRARRDRS